LTPKKAAGEWGPAFLAALSKSANVRAACQAAGISREAAYKYRERSAAFRAQWDTALEDACDVLEALAWRRASDASDVLLIFLLKAHRPAKYRERWQGELTGADAGPLRLVVEVIGDRHA
jgi:hypothetical protein